MVVGMESRGFIFRGPIAYQLGAGFVPVRKPGKLPAERSAPSTTSIRPNTLEMHRDAVPTGPAGADRRRPAGDRRHGEGTIELIERLKGEVVGVASWSNSSSSRAVTGSRAGESPASSSTDGPPDRGRRIGRLHRRSSDGRSRPGGAERRARRDRAPAATTPAATPPAAVRRRSTSDGAASSAASPASCSSTAATVAGAAQALQRASAEAAGAILDPAGVAAALAAARRSGRPPRRRPPERLPDAVPRGRRRPLPDRPAPACPTPSWSTRASRPARSPSRSARWSSAARRRSARSRRSAWRSPRRASRDAHAVRAPGDPARARPTP